MAVVTTVLDVWYSSSLNKRVKKVRAQTVLTSSAFAVTAAELGLQKILAATGAATDSSGSAYVPVVAPTGASLALADASASAGSLWPVSTDALTETLTYVVEGI